MKKKHLPKVFHYCLHSVFVTVLFMGVGCSRAQQADRYGSPAGYDLNNPAVYDMADILYEISGITFHNGRSDTIYAQQDEAGRLFYFALGDRQTQHTKFGNDGDYEDIAILHDHVIILRSDGSLYRFPLAERHGKKIVNVEVWDKPFPKGEYESLAATAGDSLLYVLCKQCRQDRKQSFNTGYAFRLGADGKIVHELTFAVNWAQIEQYVGLGGKAFRPSAITWNPFTSEWFIVSSINKMLVVTDSQWKVKNAYRLNPKLYVQPEGLAIDADRNLYISNEGGKRSRKANILKFQFN